MVTESVCVCTEQILRTWPLLTHIHTRGITSCNPFPTRTVYDIPLPLGMYKSIADEFQVGGTYEPLRIAESYIKM